MTALSISDIKGFMVMLLSDTFFDEYLLIEADIVMDCRYQISGRRVAAFYDSDDLQLRGEYCCWREHKKLVFEIIRGKRLPVSMKIVMMAPEDVRSSVASAAEGSDNTSLCINIKYDNKRLTMTTGVSYSAFTMDRTVERGWDEYLTRAVRQKGIVIE